jgi:TatD DNase family protein
MDYYDFHCHVDLMPSMETFSEEAQDARVSIVAVTTTPKAYERERDLLSHFMNIRVALGLHPQLVGKRFHELELVERLIDNVRYVGEIGLDFSRQYYSTKDIQLDVFTRIIQKCMQSQRKVISIHSVRSDKAVLDVLENSNCGQHNYCILHWYSGSIKQLDRAVALGCYFSVNLKMLDSENGRRNIKHIPFERILLETDAPFISDIRYAQQQKRYLNDIEEKLITLKGEDTTRHIRNSSQEIFI